MRRLLFLPIILLLVVACAQAEPTAEMLEISTGSAQLPDITSQPEQPITPTIIPEEPTEAPGVEISPADTLAAETAAPVETASGTTASPAAEATLPAESAPTSPPTVAAVNTEPASSNFHGLYETTYFRGSATAPVTIIDYSDFL